MLALKDDLIQQLKQQMVEVDLGPLKDALLGNGALSLATQPRLVSAGPCQCCCFPHPFAVHHQHPLHALLLPAPPPATSSKWLA